MAKTLSKQQIAQLQMSTTPEEQAAVISQSKRVSSEVVSAWLEEHKLYIIPRQAWDQRSNFQGR